MIATDVLRHFRRGRWLVAYGDVFQASPARNSDPGVDNTLRLSPLSPVTLSADGRLLCGKLRIIGLLLRRRSTQSGKWRPAVIARFEAKQTGQIADGPDNRTLAFVGWGLHLKDLSTVSTHRCL